MEEDDVDLLKPSKNEKSNEEDDTASNQIESDKMKEEEFDEKSENTRNPFLQLL